MEKIELLINQKVETKYNFSNEHIFIIGAHIDNLEKEKLLVRCIKKLREFNIEILLVTHCEIRKEIVDLVDYFISDDKNELLTFDRYKEFNIDNVRWLRANNYIINSYVDFHHDFAAITLIKNAIIFANDLGKTKIHYFDYDCIIDTKQYSQTFLADIEYYDVVFGFLFSLKMDIAQKIFVDDVTTLENHFSQPNWRFEDFLINGIKDNTTKYKASDYIDNDNSINTEAAWLRAGINRNGAYFQLYLCVDEKSDDLYISLFSNSSNCTTPTSGLIYSNVGVLDEEILLELKYEDFNIFHKLLPERYDLIKIGKYVKNKKVKINYMGIKVFEQELNKNIDEYRKTNFIKFL